VSAATPASAAGTPTRAGAASPAAGAATPRATTFPLTIKDDAGRSVTFAHAPMRIISLAPSNTEILYALSLGDRVVGVDDNSDFPAEAKAKPKVGGFAGTNLEQVVALQPDLILASGITAPDLLTTLVGRNLTVVVLNPPDLPGVLADLSLIGQIADVNAQAAQVRSGLEARIAAVTARLKTATTKPRVFFELDPTQFYTVGPHSFVDDLITRAGGTNIAADASTAYPTLSPEQIIAKDPEVIILSDENQGVTTESVKARAGWAGVSAVKTGRIAALNPDLTNRPGPRVVDALEQLALAIHPELYR
jgi:iron complex transport system substrate-binding protein